VPGSDALVCPLSNLAWLSHNPVAFKPADLLLDPLRDDPRIRADPVLFIEGGLRDFFLGATLRSRRLLLLLFWNDRLEAVRFHFVHPVLQGHGFLSLGFGFGSRACLRGPTSAFADLRHGNLFGAVRKRLRYSLLFPTVSESHRPCRGANWPVLPP